MTEAYRFCICASYTPEFEQLVSSCVGPMRLCNCVQPSRQVTSRVGPIAYAGWRAGATLSNGITGAQELVHMVVLNYATQFALVSQYRQRAQRSLGRYEVSMQDTEKNAVWLEEGQQYRIRLHDGVDFTKPRLKSARWWANRLPSDRAALAELCRQQGKWPKRARMRHVHILPLPIPCTRRSAEVSPAGTTPSIYL
ncbi:uncharacterized protein M421DRAFT_179322 [Didymella exigua CBS 183.55]|uniref:Uncharacterized protein n=1 Tax=Didymella exigua CBS 183.55 TaxID=1150837 RepID=A0A6A5RIK1_9PLEO|nr:uncharacterized protein M421DRAFT_179322 [Didymella exigua CBS 183.55]KAF1927419.1 hypothetical protein M421DRAFT_179322 [Didymella exigua CBS 183.55]